jgi:fumarate hydratase subunit beta
MAAGLRGMIGKGPRNRKVVDAMMEFGAVYFAAVGGAGVIAAEAVKSARIVAYEDLGTEAVRELEVEDFPCIVANDLHGGDIYEIGVKAYRVD